MTSDIHIALVADGMRNVASSLRHYSLSADRTPQRPHYRGKNMTISLLSEADRAFRADTGLLPMATTHFFTLIICRVKSRSGVWHHLLVSSADRRRRKIDARGRHDIGIMALIDVS